jgi:hypothetical protein
MTGKRYYLTTLRDWKRRAASFTTSHWLLLEPQTGANAMSERHDRTSESANEMSNGHVQGATRDEEARILVLIEADEGTHGSLEDDKSFEGLPHPLSDRPISTSAHTALEGQGVRSDDSMFDVTEAVARAHPLLRHRVF